MPNGRVSLWVLILAVAGCAVGDTPQPLMPPRVNASLAPPEPIRLIAGGDVNLGRGTEKRLRAGTIVDPLGGVAPALRSAQVAFVNLECALGSAQKKPAFKKAYNLGGSTTSIALLANAGIDVVSLANNHTLDFGPAVLKEMQTALDGVGVRYFGAGKNLAESRRPAYVYVHGSTLAFLGYGGAHASDYYAKPDRPGISPILLKHIREDLKIVRPQSDWVIVSIHWGMEYTHRPSRYQRELAHAIIDAGADVLLGHHAHVYQGIERYKGKVIAYSLGNLLFDQVKRTTNSGILLEIALGQTAIEEVRVIPNGRTGPFLPTLTERMDRSAVLTHLNKLSQSWATTVTQEGRVVAAPPQTVLASPPRKELRTAKN